MRWKQSPTAAAKHVDKVKNFKEADPHLEIFEFEVCFKRRVFKRSLRLGFHLHPPIEKIYLDFQVIRHSIVSYYLPNKTGLALPFQSLGK